MIRVFSNNKNYKWFILTRNGKKTIAQWGFETEEEANDFYDSKNGDSKGWAVESVESIKAHNPNIKEVREGVEIFSDKTFSAEEIDEALTKMKEDEKDELIRFLLGVNKDGEYNEKLISQLARQYNLPISKATKTQRKFSESKITSEEEFREYAHKVMRNAHGNDYSEETTNKVVDDLIKDNPDADFGELIGRLTSGLGK